MEKILHLTHIDSDALGCDVLIKFIYELVFDNQYSVTTYYIKNSNVDVFINDTIDKLITEIDQTKNASNVYDIIYITDIGPSKDSIEKILLYKDKVLEVFNKEIKLYGFDHHITNSLNKDYDWFVVANDLYSLYSYDNMRLDDDNSDFEYSYYPFVWMHDNVDIEYTSFNDVIKEKSLKISATMLTYIHILKKYANELTCLTKPSFIVLNIFEKLVKDISCYDTWEWKNNPYINSTGYEDMACKLCDMIGINSAVTTVLDTVYYEAFHPSDHITYMPENFKSIYEYEKFKSFTYVKKSYNNVKVLTGSNVKGFFNILKISESEATSNIDKVYISISDNTIALSEQGTFITNYLDYDSNCLFVHLFITSKTLSFRSSNNKNVDVSLIAKELGGGGHKNASGARVSADIIGKLVVLYHINAGDIINMTDSESIKLYVNRLTAYMETLPENKDFIYDITDIMKGN